MKIGLISLGCPKNLVDSEVMLGLAQRGGPRADAGRRRRPTCSSSTRARSSTRPSRNRSTRSSRWRAQEGRRVPAAHRDRLPRRAVSRRAEGRDAGDRRGARHRRGAGDRPRDRRRAAASPLTFFAPGPTSTELRHRHPGTRQPSAAPSPDLHLRRRHSAPARDAAALRLREDRRRLRLQVRVLHHPDAARRTIAAGRPTSIVQRGARARGARRQGTAAHLAGHDVLRHRSARARRARRACCAS